MPASNSMGCLLECNPTSEVCASMSFCGVCACTHTHSHTHTHTLQPPVKSREDTRQTSLSLRGSVNLAITPQQQVPYIDWLKPPHPRSRTLMDRLYVCRGMRTSCREGIHTVTSMYTGVKNIRIVYTHAQDKTCLATTTYMHTPAGVRLCWQCR